MTTTIDKAQEQQYKDDLKDICEKVAYVSFTDHAYKIFKSKNVTNEDIKSFVVTMFFSTYIDDEGNQCPNLDIRLTAYVNPGGSGEKEITFMFNDDDIIKAIIEKFHNEDYGVVQKHEWSFPKPNGIQLFDAQLTLDEKLGIE